MEHHFVYDIETVPQVGEMSNAQLVQYNKKFKINYKGPLTTPIDPIEYQDATEEEKLEVLEASRKAKALSPYLGQIVVIGVICASVGAFGKSTLEKRALIGKEEDILKDFWEMAGRERYRFISYNGSSFDVPYIIKRSMHYGIKPTNPAFLMTKRYQRWPHFDVMQVLADFDYRETVTLDLACETFGIESPKGGKIEAKDVEKEFKKGNIKGIAEYCLKDVAATYELFKLVDSYQPSQ